ncbi:hypothetical protein K3X13_06480 [Aliiroseovarius crassostreae]|uniref:hypothetical protein n=1 Tax=Aliiroseovarius crassostreae TaxID=154981 RepID=UPI002200BF2A|nr:hypothetical protein [Aliiroseovarius crassostreae]UWP93464.1 hypothetical protein K3X13_06480 [Aliiroseovarius crassostreae]
MSLPDLIASFDDAALIALANKGLLRRATKATGEAEVLRYDADGADLTISGQSVTIPAAGPQSATCDCPAPGMCSHILTAMLVLRNAPLDALAPAPSEEDQEEKIPTPEIPPAATATATATEALAALKSDVLQKFAGADLDGAMMLAGSAQIEDRGQNAQVSFATPEASVTFVAGQPLSAALYKGPATRKRLVVAAGAIAIRDRAGVARRGSDTPPSKPDLTGPDQPMLTEIATALETAISQVFHGSAQLTQERFLDLAISAKVQAAPRLTGQLLTLSTLSGWAEAGDIRFEGGRFLAALAQAYALVKALAQTPDDPALLGVVRRSYSPAPPMELWALGAKGWTNPNGARGLTLYLLDPKTGKFHPATVARGAGMDAGFTPARAYANPFWGVSSVPGLTGNVVTLEHPHLSPDGQLSTADKITAQINGPLSPARLQDHDTCIKDWGALRATLRSQVGQGLRRGASPLPALIAPSRIEEPYFDDISQRYRWRAQDLSGDVIELSARPQDMDHLTHLHLQFPGAVALLIVTTLIGDELLHEPVALLRPDGSGLTATNLDFQPAPEGGILTRAKGGLLRGLKHFRGTELATHDSGFAAQVLSHLAEQCRHLQPDHLADLARGAEARQFLLLADALERLRRDQPPAQILATAYLCHEMIVMTALGQ